MGQAKTSKENGMKKKFIVTAEVIEEYNGSCVNCFLNDVDVNCSQVCPGGKKILVITKIERMPKDKK